MAVMTIRNVPTRCTSACVCAPRKPVRAWRDEPRFKAGRPSIPRAVVAPGWPGCWIPMLAGTPRAAGQAPRYGAGAR